MRVELQPAYVLHTRHYRDTSMLVDFFTPQYGRVSAVAKGVRAVSKTAKQKRSLLQSFKPLLISWGGKSDLKSLFHIEAQAASYALQGERLFSAMYVNELLTRLLQAEEENDDIFYLYQQVLIQLNLHEPVDIILRRFELTLLNYLGYGLQLENVADTGEAIAPDGRYQYFPERGFSAYHGDQPLRNSFNGADLLAIAAADFQPTARAAAKRLCRQALGFYLGAKPLKSRELFL
ncbi:DNA repair protein RecO [Dasania marina]|uniref:DNA repair protein RecO n=1 Tax=Dasania marina TaxID=471499 RepID=UPI00037DEDD2|nr:DNA repair protein RecO [Dasania marina]